MIVNCYKDINMMADVFVFQNGTRYAMYWNKGELKKLGMADFKIANAPGGMKYIAKHHENFILKHGVKL
jgi:hypothetical protein